MQQTAERFIWRIVGPEAEDAAGMQRGRQRSNATLGVERAIVRV